MAIVIRCKCKTELKTNTKKCHNCGAVIPSKGKTYKVILRAGGRKITRSVTNYALAQDIEAKLKVEISRGENDLQRKKAAPTLATVWKKYEPWAKENKKSWKTDKYYYEKHLRPPFGDKALDNISPFDIEKLMLEMKKRESKREKPYSMATIKHQVVLLSRIYSIAEQWGMYSGLNPCKKVKKPKLNNKKTEYLNDEETKRLMEVLDNWKNKLTVAFVKFAFYTGFRRGELFNLTWNDIDWERQTIVLRDPKGGTDQILPLSNQAVKVLKEIPREFETPWIFYGKNGKQRKDFKGPWERIRKQAGLPDDFRFHGLRHHFASTLASSGVDLYVIQKLLTHKDATTTQRYAHLADSSLRKAVSLSDSLLQPKTKGQINKLEEK